MMGGQLCTHPPCAAAGAVPQGPNGQETTPAKYPHSKYSNPARESGTRRSWVSISWAVEVEVLHTQWAKERFVI